MTSNMKEMAEMEARMIKMAAEMDAKMAKIAEVSFRSEIGKPCYLWNFGKGTSLSRLD